MAKDKAKKKAKDKKAKELARENRKLKKEVREYRRLYECAMDERANAEGDVEEVELEFEAAQAAGDEEAWVESPGIEELDELDRFFAWSAPSVEAMAKLAEGWSLADMEAQSLADDKDITVEQAIGVIDEMSAKDAWLRAFCGVGLDTVRFVGFHAADPSLTQRELAALLGVSVGEVRKHVDATALAWARVPKSAVHKEEKDVEADGSTRDVEAVETNEA